MGYLPRETWLMRAASWQAAFKRHSPLFASSLLLLAFSFLLLTRRFKSFMTSTDSTFRNRYNILEQLGAGGAGTVYSVREVGGGRGEGRRLALKALFTDQTRDEQLIDTMRQEFRVLATLRHPHLARVYDFGRIPADNPLPGSKGRPGVFFTRDMVEGEDLADYCRNLPPARVLRVLQRTAEALDLLHRAGMVHGDFKPANVIVDQLGQPHLIDFGLVRGEGKDSSTSGTAAYLAPESLRGEIVDRRVDLYALGITLFQLLAGRLPLPGASLHRVLNWHLEGPPLELEEDPFLSGTLLAAINKVLGRLADRDRRRRYPSSGEAALALGELVEAAGGRRDPGDAEIPFIHPAPGENLTELVAELEQVVGLRLLGGEQGPPLVLLSGEPGSGKSTLLTEVAWRCQLRGVEVLRGEFMASDPRVLGTWHDLLALVQGFSGKPHPLQDRTADDAYGLYQQLCDYLVACAGAAPLLILLDSAHEAGDEDRAALRFIRHTLPPNAPVMFIMASRADETLAGDLGQPTARSMAPLAEGDLARMVRDASGREDSELGRSIHQHTGGNPRFALQVLERLSEHGWPTSPDLRSLAPPGELERMHRARWERLEPSEQETLQALAVLGRPAGGGVLLELVLEAAMGDEVTLVGLPLEHLEQAEWLQRTPEGLYQFNQGPVSALVLGWSDGGHKRGLHRAAAAVLQRAGDQDPVERVRHAVGAGEAELALDALAGARESLAGLGAHRRAVQLHQDTLGLLRGDDGRRPGLLGELGRLQRAAGDLDPALRTLEEACDGLVGAEGALARMDLAAVHRDAGRGERAVEVLTRLLAGPLEPAEEVKALSELATTQVALDEHEAVLETVDRALELMSRAGPDAALVDAPAEARLRGNRAWSLGYLQRHDQSDRAFQRALDAARASESSRTEASILNMMAVLAFRRADYGRMGELSLEALACADAASDIERAATIRLNLGVFHVQRGEYADCLKHLEQSLRLFEAMGARKHLATARCNHGYVQLKLGLLERARRTLRQAVNETREVGRRSGEALALLLLALVEARQGQAERARQGIDRARRIYLEIGQQRDAGDALLDLAQVELDVGQAESARQALDRAGEELDLDELPDLAARELALRARLAVFHEDAGALEGLDRALGIARELDSADLIWECHAAGLELAAALGRTELAAEHAHAAAEIQERMARGLASEVRAAFWQDSRRQKIRDMAADQVETAHPVQVAGLHASKRSGGLGLLETMRAPGSREGGQDTPMTHIDQERTKERFYRLLEIYRRINSELDPERLLGLVMDTAVELTGAERGFLLLGDSPDDIKVEVARNLVLEGEEGEYSRSIAERVFRSGRPVITVSAHNDPRFQEYLSVHQLQLESVLCIPIHARDRVTGVLYMESRFQSGRFTPEDQRLLMAFGDQVAIALTNAHLLQDNIRKAEALELANAKIEALAEERGRLLDRRTEQLEQVRRDLAETRRKLESNPGMFGMVGRSEPMLQLFHLVERVARTDVPVLVEGESGTGKEMVARAIHDNSGRKDKRLVSVNCAAIPEGLLESELFGHVRGAFTGADRDRKGLFQASHGGTLFLDEIGDMPHRMQVDLLRALQEKTIRPVGAQKDLKVDVRVIAASNKPLAELVQQGRFREDLFYRLNVVCLKLPPLRQRADDIPLLVDLFLERISTQVKGPRRRVRREAMRHLMAYGWPGNVRQLEHALMNAAVLADGDLLGVDDFNLDAPPTVAATPSEDTPVPSSRGERKAQEMAEILQALEACSWNKSKAARLLGIPRRTFYRRLTSHGIS